jgi:hypothetical protein
MTLSQQALGALAAAPDQGSQAHLGVPLNLYAAGLLAKI